MFQKPRTAGDLPNPRSHPLAYWPAKDTQRDGDQPCHYGNGEQDQTTKLPADKRMSLVVTICQLDAFHDELHHLGANEQRPNPAEKYRLPGVHFPVQQ